MKKKVLGGLLFAVAALAGVGLAAAGERPRDLGRSEYESNCALCHGKDLKGGAYIDFLKVAPPDLTELSKRNGGVFPLERVYGVIDGRQEVKLHGPRDMPVWGRDYQVRAAEYYIDVSYDVESFVRGRILALVDFLNRMQSK